MLSEAKTRTIPSLFPSLEFASSPFLLRLHYLRALIRPTAVQLWSLVVALIRFSNKTSPEYIRMCGRYVLTKEHNRLLKSKYFLPKPVMTLYEVKGHNEAKYDPSEVLTFQQPGWKSSSECL